jgi:hypothetical protein
LWRVHGDAAVVLGELTPHDALVVEERLADLIELGLRRAVQARECIGIDGGGAAEFVGVGHASNAGKNEEEFACGAQPTNKPKDVVLDIFQDLFCSPTRVVKSSKA